MTVLALGAIGLLALWAVRDDPADAEPAVAGTTEAATPPDSTSAASAPPAATRPPTTVASPATTATDPASFSTPEQAIADWASTDEAPYVGPCEFAEGREAELAAELGGEFSCSILVQDLLPARIYGWFVYPTEDLGLLLLDVGSAGWSIADEAIDDIPPAWLEM